LITPFEQHVTANVIVFRRRAIFHANFTAVSTKVPSLYVTIPNRT
jgi:hypothetical protein